MLAERDLLSQGLPVVQAVSRKLARRLGRHVHVDDLLGIGNAALLEVARSYDPSRANFAAYAATRLRWAILDGLRRETHGRSTAARAAALLASERVGEAYGEVPEPDAPTTIEQDQARLDEMLADHAAALAVGLLATRADPPEDVLTPEEELSRAETWRTLRAAVGSLPERERALVERHYFGDEQFDEIARELGISKSWASRLHQQAMSAIRRALTMGPQAAPNPGRQSRP
jgi:RNA polymerase sigma factor for flagellar operon FliA